MTPTQPANYRVQAYNTAKDSDNKIHDDDVAARFGFRGGLVPGVDVYAYMTHPVVARWGVDWLARGSAECRLEKPVYDGEFAEVEVSADGDGVNIVVESCGLRCASGHAALPRAAMPSPALGDEIAVADPAQRPPADEVSLAPGTRLGMNPVPVTAEYAAEYLHEVRETHALYAREGLVHPGLILRAANWVVKQNVVLGPWMHVGSTVQHLSLSHIGDVLTARAQVLRNYVHKGHKFIEVDVVVVKNGDTAIAHISHTAIYQPRQVTQ